MSEFNQRKLLNFLKENVTFKMFDVFCFPNTQLYTKQESMFSSAGCMEGIYSWCNWVVQCCIEGSFQYGVLDHWWKLKIEKSYIWDNCNDYIPE